MRENGREEAIDERESGSIKYTRIKEQEMNWVTKRKKLWMKKRTKEEEKDRSGVDEKTR